MSHCCWLYNKGLGQGVLWGTLIYVASSINDVLMKMLGECLPATETVFFRFLFSFIVIAIPVLFSKKQYYKTNMHGLHATRGIIGYVALGLCCYSVKVMPLAENTTILFSEALFLLPLSYIFLKESISLKIIIANLMGFIGLLIMFRPQTSNFNSMAFVPTIAAILFAAMDIIIKKMVNNEENNITMLFYFGLYTTIISGIFAPWNWVNPTVYELWLILLLGIGSNIIQLFVFLAYRATSASNLSVIRYTELPIAIFLGYLFFGQVPQTYSLISACLIIFSTSIMTRSKT